MLRFNLVLQIFPRQQSSCFCFFCFRLFRQMVLQWHPWEKRSPTMLFCPCINRLFDTHQFSHVNTQIVYFDVSGCSKRWQYDGTFGQSDCHIRYTNRLFCSLISGHSERWYYNRIPGQSATHQCSFVYTLTPTTFFQFSQFVPKDGNTMASLG